MHPSTITLCLCGSLAAQASWTQLTPAVSPSARTEVAMDSDGSGALLFGGQYGPGVVAYNELWRFDGTTWTQQVPTGAAPPARSRFAAAFDPIRQRFVIFGGDGQYAGGGTLGDTWEWDPVSSTWTQAFPNTSPSPRIHARMAFDLVNVRLLMFGGRGAGAAETWSWDGLDWTLQNPANVPPGREQAHLATHWGTGQIVMFGGSTGAASGVIGDTWIWNGTDWTAVTTTTVPGTGGLRNGKMTYDSLRERIVVHGGITSLGAFSASVWEFDGNDWSERLPTPRPNGRTGAGLCHVAQLGTTVLFGGYSGGVFGDTWIYQTNAPASATGFGIGCATSAGVPTLTAAPLPWLGGTVQFSLGNLPPTGLPFLLLGLSNTAWAGGALPQPMAAFGFPTCTLLVSPDASTFTLSPINLSLPNAPGFLGLQLHAQAAVLEPAGAGFGLGLSGATTLTLGAR